MSIGVRQDSCSKSLRFTIRGSSMFPTYRDGDSVSFKKIRDPLNITIGDIIVFPHPLKEDFMLIKRVKKISGNNKVFVEGDNKDILGSEDSHNFGLINCNTIIAIRGN